jgi:hypothetical protein
MTTVVSGGQVSDILTSLAQDVAENNAPPFVMVILDDEEPGRYSILAAGPDSDADIMRTARDILMLVSSEPIGERPS